MFSHGGAASERSAIAGCGCDNRHANQTYGRSFNVVTATAPGVARGPTTFITSDLTGMSLGATLPSMAEAVADPEPPKPRNRDDATKIIAETRRIVTLDGSSPLKR
jgi:hypothetical protein